MPLPPLPPSNTSRIFINYVAYGNLRHTFQIRPISTATVVATVAWINGLLTDYADLWATNTVFDSCDVAVINSDVRNPYAWDSVTGTAAPPNDLLQDTRQLSWVGREVTGRKSNWKMYGSKLGPDATSRKNLGDDARLDAFTQALNDLDALAGGITGAKLSWKRYTNVRQNGYWQNEVRG